MFEAIIEVILWILSKLVLRVFWWLVLFPVVWLVSLPLILVLAAFQCRPYFQEVGTMLFNVTVFWRDKGWAFVP